MLWTVLDSLHCLASRYIKFHIYTMQPHSEHCIMDANLI